jgi:hypothetical protein
VRLRKPHWLLAAALISVLTPAVVAQKAQPVRLEPPTSGHPSSIAGKLSGSQQMQYAVNVRPQQYVTCTLIAPGPRPFDLEVHTEAGEKIALVHPTSHQWTFHSAAAGDYEVSVVRIAPRKGTTPYRLNISLR